VKTKLIFPAIIVLLSLTSANDLTGRWESRMPDGNILGIRYKPDNSFEGYFNKKPFVSGTYTFQDSILAFRGNGCNGVKCFYKIIFFSNSDSMRWKVINDSCVARKEGMDNMVFGKVK
jgi:hypothetical protein